MVLVLQFYGGYGSIGVFNLDLGGKMFDLL